MSKYLILARINQLKDKLQPKSLAGVLIGNQIIPLIFCVILIICGLSLYLYQINSLATKGYAMKDLEKRAEQLKQDNRDLQLEITDLRSTARISEEIKKLNMEKVARIDYLTQADNAVAMNR